jgi:hypothetical protein
MTEPTSMPSSLVLFALSFSVLLTFVLLLWAINMVKQRLQRPNSQMPRQALARPSTTAPTSAHVVAQVGASVVLPLRAWLDWVNNQPDRVPHLAAKGPSGSGKTTLVMAVLADRPGKVLICTPKHARDDSWGGAPAVRLTADLSFDAIETTLRAVHHEVKRRNVAGFDAWLTVVLDDYPWIAQECPSASKVVTLVGNMGRSVRVRLILLAQTATVKAWGFEGNGEARANFVFLDVADDHTAVLYRWGKPPEPIDTSRVCELAQRPIPHARWCTLTARDEHREHAQLDAAAAESGNTAEIPLGAEPHFSAQESDVLVSDLPFSAEEIAQITAQIIAGTGKTEIVKAMPRYSGRRHSTYAAFYDRIRAALAIA